MLKRIRLFLIMIAFGLSATPISADCYQDCDQSCLDMLEVGARYYSRCLLECYEYCVSIGAGGGGGPYQY